MIKRVPLNQLLFLPEPFYAEHIEEIAKRRDTALALLSSSTDNKRQRFVVMGLLKAVKRSKYGSLGFELSHLGPSARFWLSAENAEKYLKSFNRGHDEQYLLTDDARVFVIMAIDKTDKGNYSVASIAQMRTTLDYIPVDSRYEAQVVEKLIKEQRYFRKPLRFDATQDAVFPDFLLFDADEQPLPMEVYGVVNNAEYSLRKMKKILHYGENYSRYWQWDVSVTPDNIPPLPEKQYSGACSSA